MSGAGIAAASVLLTLTIAGAPIIIYYIRRRDDSERFGWMDRSSGEGEGDFEEVGEAVKSAARKMKGDRDE